MNGAWTISVWAQVLEDIGLGELRVPREKVKICGEADATKEGFAIIGMVGDNIVTIGRVGVISVIIIMTIAGEEISEA